jgi:hypothetical protein
VALDPRYGKSLRDVLETLVRFHSHTLVTDH